MFVTLTLQAQYTKSDMDNWAILDGKWISKVEFDSITNALANQMIAPAKYYTIVHSGREDMCLCIDFFTELPLNPKTFYRDCGNIRSIRYGTDEYVRITRYVYNPDGSINYNAETEHQYLVLEEGTFLPVLNVAPLNVKTFEIRCDEWSRGLEDKNIKE